MRNTVAGARASEQASAGDVAVRSISALHAELANDYFMLRGARHRAGAARPHRGRLREGAGAHARTCTRAARPRLPTCNRRKRSSRLARTQAEDTRLRRAQTEHAIAVLVGREASGFHLESAAARGRRGAARHRSRLAFAASGAAPRCSCRGAARRRGQCQHRRRARSVFSRCSASPDRSGWRARRVQTGSGAPALLVGRPAGLLTAVRCRRCIAAQTAAAHAAYDEQVANYRSTVLTAFQDVEDNLAALRQLRARKRQPGGRCHGHAGRARAGELRYKGGIVTYLEVVSTENAALTARLSAVDIQTRRIAASVLLVKALGGDWNTPARYCEVSGHCFWMKVAHFGHPAGVVRARNDVATPVRFARILDDGGAGCWQVMTILPPLPRLCRSRLRRPRRAVSAHSARAPRRVHHPRPAARGCGL